MTLLRRVIGLGIRSLIGRRLYSTDLKSKGPWVQTDFLSPTQAEYLDASLEGYLPVGRVSRLIGENAPPGYHLIYFNPKNGEHTLSSDGYESHQSPGPEYPNRMWVGGSVEFNLESELKLGLPSTATETISDVKQSQSDAGKLTVTIDRKLKNKEEENHDWSVRELRSLIYFTEQSGNRKNVFDRFLKPRSSDPAHTHTLRPSSLLLFRYSALTFNSHKIHFDREYATQVENLPDVVVHGPLMVTLLLRWMSTSVLGHLENVRIKSFSYKNLLPMFVNNDLTLCSGPVENGAKYVDVWIQDHRGSMTLSGSMELAKVLDEPDTSI